MLVLNWMTVAGLKITKNVLPEWQLERSKASLAGHVDLSRLTKRDNLQSLTSPGGGGGVSKEICGNGPPASMTSRLASVTLKTASKVFIEETDKNFDFITEILFRFLGFGDFKVSIVTEN